MQQSPAKFESGVTKKDKISEKKLGTIPAEDATHGSDACDQILWWAYEMDGISAMSNGVDGMKT
jgi:hypothetical protein